MRLSLEATRLLQRLRRAYVEAGEAGYLAGGYWSLAPEGARCCVVGRAARLEGCFQIFEATQFHCNSPLLAELQQACRAVAGRSLVALNDELGFAATCAVLDRLVAECAAPAAVEASVEAAA